MTNDDIKTALQKAQEAVFAAQTCAENSEWQAVANWTLAARQYLQAVAGESADRVHRARMRRHK